MSTGIKIHPYDNFIRDLKIKNNKLNLFYYYLSTAKECKNGNEYYAKTDGEILAIYESQVMSHQFYLHILSSDIVDDTVVVSKLVDPYINEASAYYIHVMYRKLDSDNKYRYYPAYTIDVPSFNSEITKNDYNYLYFDLTELGSVLADIRLNNTYPIYETSHVVSGDSLFVGSGMTEPSSSSIQSPKSNIDALDGLSSSELSPPDPTLNIRVSLATEPIRQYTEEFYHMGDFTIRLLGKSLTNNKAEGYITNHTPSSSRTDLNFLNVINPTEPDKRTLEYVNSNQMSNLYKPRINNETDNYLFKKTLTHGQYYKLLKFYYPGGLGTIKIELSSNYGAHFNIILKADEAEELHNSYIYGISGDINIYVIYRNEGSRPSFSAVYVYCYVSGNYDEEVIVNNIDCPHAMPMDYGDSYVEYSSDWIRLLPTMIESNYNFENKKTYSELYEKFSSMSGVTAWKPVHGDINGKELKLRGCDFTTVNGTRVLTEFEHEFTFNKVWNNCVYITNNGSPLYPSSGNTSFSTDSCMVIREINTDLSSIISNQSYIGNILINSSDSYHTVTLSSKYIIHMPPKSKFFYRLASGGDISFTGGFIENGTKAVWYTNPDIGSTNPVNHYKYGLDQINHTVITSGNCFIRSNLNKVHYIINDQASAANAVIYVHQCRYIKYSNAMYGALLTDSNVGSYEGNSYHKCTYNIQSNIITKYTESEAPGNITLGVKFPLMPHSLTVYASEYNDGTLYHKILYRLPIYYT